jgi:hypothetical protein
MIINSITIRNFKPETAIVLLPSKHPLKTAPVIRTLLSVNASRVIAVKTGEDERYKTGLLFCRMLQSYQNDPLCDELIAAIQLLDPASTNNPEKAIPWYMIIAAAPANPRNISLRDNKPGRWQLSTFNHRLQKTTQDPDLPDFGVAGSLLSK